MKRSAAVPLVFTAALATSLTGCTGGEEYHEVCKNAQGKRVDSSECRRAGSGSSFVYFGPGASYPGYGDTVNGGSNAKPKSGTIKGAPAKGGSVPRGGFGGGGKSGG